MAAQPKPGTMFSQFGLARARTGSTFTCSEHLADGSNRPLGLAFEGNNMAVNRTRTDIASLIERYLDGKTRKMEWDDFLTIRITSPDLDKLRIVCGRLPLRFPDKRGSAYANAEGLQFLRILAFRLRNEEEFPDLAQLVEDASEFGSE